MNIYEGNDLRDAVHYRLYRAGGRDAGFAPGPCTALRKAACLFCSWLGASIVGRASYALNLAATAADGARYAVQRGLTSLSSRGRKKEPKPNFRYQIKLSGAAVAFNPSNTDSDEVVYARCYRNREIDLEIFVEPLRAFVELSRRYGFVPVVAYTPSAHTVYLDKVTFDDPAIRDDLTALSRGQRDFFQAKGKELGYIFIDLTGALRAAVAPTGGAEELLYYPGNLHLTARGHAVVAAAMDRFLKELPADRAVAFR